MKYTIKFKWWYGDVEEVTVDNAKSRDNWLLSIMRHKDDITSCSYFPIYKNGSYGIEKIVF